MSDKREQYTKVTKRRKKPMKGKALTRKQKAEVKQIVHGTIKQELKHHDKAIAIQGVSTGTPYITDITDIGQGLGDTQRIGDEVTLQSVLLRLLLFYKTPSFYSAQLMQVMRVICFQWREDSASTVPTATDILQAFAVGYDICRPLKIDNDKKYRILFDRQYELTDRTALGHIVDVFINTKFSKTIQFTNAASTGTDHVYLMILSSNDSDFDVNNLPNVSIRTRVRYTDA